MEPVKLDYFTPRPAPFPWGLLLPLFFLGPFTGGLVGVVQTTAAVLLWVHYGRPAFYFHGWWDVELHYTLWPLGGAGVGVIYALVLWALERLTRRRIRAKIAIPMTVLLAFAVAGVIVAGEFQQREIWLFAQEATAIAMGLATCMASARREMNP